MFFNRLGATIVLGLLTTGVAHADLFDLVNKAVGAAKTVGVPVPAATTSWTSATPGSAPSARPPLPFDLQPYPRSVERRRIDNPLARVSMPISVPVKTPDGYVAPYSVPMEGRITMQQYVHRSDDSPLLIRQFYEAAIANAGFERLAVCEAPCHRLEVNLYWRPAVDPDELLNFSDLPTKPTYIVGYKNDAMILVGIGSWNSDAYSSVVKIVQGRVLDPQPWLTVTTPRTAPPPVALSRAATPPPPPADTPAGLASSVEMLAPADLTAAIAASKGYVVLQLSSYDSNCTYCAPANLTFDQLASHSGGKATFLRAMYQPWRSAWPNDTFVKTYGITGLPTSLTFKNGQLVRRITGNYTLAEIDKQLLQGLR